MSDATPGQRAYEAWQDVQDPEWKIPWDSDGGFTLTDETRAAFEAAAQAVLNDAFPGLKRELGEARAVVADMIRAYGHVGRDRWVSEVPGSRLPEWHDQAGLTAEADLGLSAEGAPPVTPLDTALEHVREARQFLAERNRYRKALEAIRDGDNCNVADSRSLAIAREALGGDHA